MRDHFRFTYSVANMGCKANLTDSQAMESKLQKLGGVAAQEENADLLLLNTCTVTDQADREALSILQKSSASFTIATGCLAEVDPTKILGLGRDNLFVVRNSAKSEIEGVVASWLDGRMDASQLEGGDRISWHKKIIKNHDGSSGLASSQRTRAFYKVQDGCDAFCAYCVIPLARGRSRSLSPAEIVRDIQGIVDNGVHEVVLTAIHAADYSADGLDFTGLVEKILRETTVKRLRLTSLDPAEISDHLISLMADNSRLCPHFHLSIQSASSRVLKLMKRNYLSQQIVERVSTITCRVPHVYIGMDLIAGFPGESNEDFEEGFSLLENLAFTKAHVFPFSVRRNTAAARMVESGLAVAAEEIKERAFRLRELSQKKLNQALSDKIGSLGEVLVESKTVKVGSRSCSFGHARNFHKVLIPGSHTVNDLKRVRIVGIHQEFLKGELL